MPRGSRTCCGTDWGGSYIPALPRLSHREQEAYYATLRAGTHLLDSGTIVTTLGVRPDHAKRNRQLAWASQPSADAEQGQPSHEWQSDRQAARLG
jgi:hypothetical protein